MATHFTPVPNASGCTLHLALGGTMYVRVARVRRRRRKTWQTPSRTKAAPRATPALPRQRQERQLGRGLLDLLDRRALRPLDTKPHSHTQASTNQPPPPEGGWHQRRQTPNATPSSAVRVAAAGGAGGTIDLAVLTATFEESMQRAISKANKQTYLRQVAISPTLA